MSISTTVVVPTHNRAADLRITLESLAGQAADGLAYEVIVVDNVSTDDTAEQVSRCQGSLGFPLRYHYEPRLGLHYARHAGAQLAEGRILLYVDDDICAQPGWLAALDRPFSDAKVGVVAGRILPEWPSDPPVWVKRFHPGYLSLLDLGDRPLELHWPQSAYGANFAIRRSVLFEVGGFNPDGFADPALRWHRGDGETGLLQKVYAAGYRVRYEPAAGVRHRISTPRLTVAYFERRAFNEGVSNSFSAVRARRYPFPELEVPSQTSRDVENNRWLRMARLALACLSGDPAAWVEARVRLAYWHGRLGHAAHVTLSRPLREHVLKTHYFSD